MENNRINRDKGTKKRKLPISESNNDYEPECQNLVENKITKTSNLSSKNPYEFTHIIEKLGYYAAEPVIANLKQVATNYHKILNPLYINVVNKTISFHHITQDRKDDGDYAIKTLTKSNRQLGKGITCANWDPKMAYIFQNLELGDVWFNNMKIYHDGLLFSSVISKLCSYITKITINFLPRDNDMCKPGLKLAKFMQKFTQLKELNLGCDNSYFKISMDEIDIMLRSLNKSNVKVTMTVNWNHTAVIAKFYELHNLKFNVEARLIDCLPELEAITTLIAQYKNHVENLSLELFLRDENFSADQEQAVNEKLIELCSICTTLDLHQSGMSVTMDVLAGCNSWPKLRNLIITEYQHPLSILKCSPNLETLSLDINQSLCIFHDVSSNKSATKCLKEYFSHLPLLKSLRIYGRGMINQLREYLLEELLPKGVELVVYC